MIFLIDDKISRQNDYGWSPKRFAEFTNITVINNLQSLEEKISAFFSSDDNIVLFHESFYNSSDYEVQQKLKALKSELRKHEGKIPIAYFSGSKNSRWIDSDGKVCMIPPDILYFNLSLFANKCQDSDFNFKYLLFGENLEIESRLKNDLEEVNNKNWTKNKFCTEENIFYAFTNKYACDCLFNNANVNSDWDFFKSIVSDEDLDQIVKEWFANKEYDTIYIPICFGETLSDFMGLRMAMHIRLTDTICKYKPIYIYGEVSIDDIYGNDCFDILKSAGVSLIHCDYDSMKLSSLNRKANSEDILEKEIKNIHLPIPTNIGDNHSVTNKWGIYRWSIALNYTDYDIEKKHAEIESTLYFKYLSALYPPTTISSIKKEQLKLENENMPVLNILYVDDEADEGWYKLLFHILCEENDIHHFNYIGRDMKSKTQAEIVDSVMRKIKDCDVNLVILDLRLHPTDFDSTMIENITGYKILKAIKNYNRGIQVLMFSATNKIWNLQALQKEECDGFIMKEAPNNSVDSHFTEESIMSFINSIDSCSERVFRKKIWPRIQDLITKVNRHLKFNYIDEKYADNVLTLLEMFEASIFDNSNEDSIDLAFINLFSIIELTANDWIVKKEGKNGKKYYFKDSQDPLFFFNLEQKNIRPGSEFLGKLDWGQKIANTLYHVQSYDTKIRDLVDKRNSYTHPKEKITYFSIEDIFNIFRVVEKIINNIKDN